MRSLKIAWLCLAVTLAACATVASPASATSFGVAAWGSNSSGQLGNGGAMTKSGLPVAVCGVGTEAPCGEDLGEVTAVSAGGQVGHEHSLALLQNGAVVAWGSNGEGELGNGSEKEDSKIPVFVCAVGAKAPCAEDLEKVTAVSAGGNHNLALLKTGTVVEWGAGHDIPVAVEGVSEVAAVSAGEYFNLALLKNGTVVAWGENSSGQLGDGMTTSSTVPVQVCEMGEKAPCTKYLSGVKAISAGGGHGLALLEKNGKVVSWGNNIYGELGNGTTENSDVPVYVCTVGAKVPCAESEYLNGVTSVSSGGEFGAGFSLALLEESKEVVAWGVNWGGQLGDGTVTGPSKCFFSEACSPTPVATNKLTKVIAISAGGSHSLALLENETVEAWGYNNEGQLGDGSTATRDVPVSVDDLSEVAGISAGARYSLSFGLTIPTVNEMSPDSGETKGGGKVIIKGLNFTGATKVKFGSAEATFEVISSTEIEAIAPAETPATVHVRVTTPAGTSPLNGGSDYTYLPSNKMEFGKCSKVTAGKGKYKTAACTTEMIEGNYEWAAGAVKKGFTAKSAKETTTTIEAVGGAKMVCQAESATGEYTGKKQVAGMIMTLTGCEYPATSTKCSSVEAGAGEVKTNVLEGTLGWIDEETDKVGLDLFPASEGTQLLEASCGATSIAVKGSVITVITPINNTSPTFTLKYNQTKGKQERKHFEGEAEDVLEMSINGGSFEKAGLDLESTLTNEEELEINTVF